jgi:phage shock protein PspC (stress-responsive transcriptional regulator)
VLTLIRPKSGRIVTGVALGISELYGIPATTLRIAWVAAMIASPIAVLIYLLLSISTSNEASVTAELSVEGIDSGTSAGERFTRFSQALEHKFVAVRSAYAIPTNFVAIGLLAIATFLELSKVEGARY